jgi:hypothetical protein
MEYEGCAPLCVTTKLSDKGENKLPLENLIFTVQTITTYGVIKSRRCNEVAWRYAVNQKVVNVCFWAFPRLCAKKCYHLCLYHCTYRILQEAVKYVTQ